MRGRGVEQTRGRGRSRGKSVQQREPSPDPIPPPIPPTNYEDTTDPKGVTTPVLELIHPTLRDAWRVNGTNKMETIFDSVNPVRQFRRGEIYDETAEDAFAEYEPSPELDPNLTESDEDCNLKPYNPITFV